MKSSHGSDMTITCVICGGPIPPHQGRGTQAIYCNSRCKRIAWRRAHPEWVRPSRAKKANGIIKSGKCLYCGALSAPGSNYCSPGHRVQYNQQNKSEDYKAEERRKDALRIAQKRAAQKETKPAPKPAPKPASKFSPVTGRTKVQKHIDRRLVEVITTAYMRGFARQDRVECQVIWANNPDMRHSILVGVLCAMAS